MRVCVTGSFGGGDIGDDAMVFPHLENLASLGIAKRDIWLIGHIPDYMARHYDHPIDRCLPSAGFDPTVELITNTAALLVTGGGTINTRDLAGGSLRRMHQLVMTFAVNKVPVFMSGQTIGPLGITPQHDKLAKELVETVEVLTVRDRKYSREYLEKIGAKPKELIETVDDATHVPMDSSLPIKLPEGPKVAVNITLYTFDTPAKQAAVAELCRRLKKKGFTVLLVPHHAWDFENLKKIDAPATLINTLGWRGGATKRLFASCDVVVAGRYHVAVFAMSAGVPCVGVSGNRYSWIKQHGFADQLGIGNMVVPPEKITDVNFLMKKVEEANEISRSYAVPESVSFARFRDWMKEKMND